MRRSLFFLLVSFLTSIVHAEIIFVSFQGTGTQEGSSWENSSELTQALQNSNSGDELWVKQGVYESSINLSIPEGLTVFGGFKGMETTPSERDLFTHVTTFSAPSIQPQSNVLLDGITFTTPFGIKGRGIELDSVNRVLLTRCELSGNRWDGAMGAGIYCFNSEVQVLNCLITDNTINRELFGSPTTKELVGLGAGLYALQSQVTIEESVFHSNLIQLRSVAMGSGTFTSARAQGGAIYLEDSTFTLSGVKIQNNLLISQAKAEDTSIFSGEPATALATAEGGGIYAAGDSILQITNSFFTNNLTASDSTTSTLADETSVATSSGAALLLSGMVQCNINFCTIIDHSSTAFAFSVIGLGEEILGAAIHSGSDLNIRSSILWNNSLEELNNTGGEPSVIYSVVEGGYIGEGNLDRDPLLLEDFTLSIKSPCIDTGDPDLITETDLNGVSRPFDVKGKGRDLTGDEFDMGAFELHAGNADINNDGMVNYQDLFLLRMNWQE